MITATSRDSAFVWGEEGCAIGPFRIQRTGGPFSVGYQYAFGGLAGFSALQCKMRRLKRSGALGVKYDKIKNLCQ
jgi:hypothetical protein